MKKRGMKKTLIIVLAVLFLVSGVTGSISIGVGKNPVNTNGDTLFVGGSGPGNYTSIQNAIDNATDGDTVFVYEGTYPEILLIEKSITLIGNSTESVLVNGTNYTNALITITADHVTLSNVTVQGKGTAYYPRLHCIHVTGDETILTNLNVQNTDYAITIDGSSHNLLAKNHIHNYLLDGYQLKNTQNNLICNNTIHGSEGISMENSYNNVIRDNYIKGSEKYLSYCIYMRSSTNNLFLNNTIITTTIGFFIGHNCQNITLQKNNIEINNYVWCGIYLESVNECTLLENTIHGDTTASYGIWFIKTTNTEIHNNTITQAQQGILIDQSTENTLTNNHISENIQGIMMKRSNHNLIHSNKIYDNFYGIKLTLSRANTIYNNLFFNEKNTETDFFGLFCWNQWNIKKTEGKNIIGGSYLGGNCWNGPQGYNGKDNDNDGIGDTWYRIGIMGIDFAPLVET